MGAERSRENRWQGVLPVVDILRGVAVHARGGDRSRYLPVQSRLCADGSLAEFARSIRGQLQLQEVYCADLDALQGGAIQWAAIDWLLKESLDLWLDVGVSEPSEVVAVLRELEQRRASHSSLIVALETWREPSTLPSLVASVGAERLVFSLDLKERRPLARHDGWGDSAAAIARRVVEAGVRRIILLDLAEVGRGGGNWSLPHLQALVRAFPEVAWYAGGGVRSTADLRELVRLGCAGALVGTAFHTGDIDGESLASVAAEAWLEAGSDAPE